MSTENPPGRMPIRDFVAFCFAFWGRVAGAMPRSAALSMVGPAVLVVLGYLFWVSYGASRLDRSLYGLEAANITLTPRPQWVPPEIIDQVYQGSQLQRLSLLDREASSTVAAAFANHPWIARVLRVQKMAGAQIKVDVEYRRPFAWVHHERRASPEELSALPSGGSPAAGAIGRDGAAIVDEFYIVDQNGVNLPRDGFVWEDVGRYFQIYCPDVAPPSGNVGSSYNDPRVLKALQVAAYLEPLRVPLDLERINVHTAAPAAGADIVFEVQLRDGRRINWGHAPGEEVSGESSADVKRRQLERQLVQAGPPAAALPTTVSPAEAGVD